MRPFLRLALSTPRPVGVAIRALKPEVLVARRRVPRLVHPRQVLALASTVRGEREVVVGLVEVAGLRAGARETPVGFGWWLRWREGKEKRVRRRRRRGEEKMLEVGAAAAACRKKTARVELLISIASRVDS